MRRSRRTSGHPFWLYERSVKRRVRKVPSKDTYGAMPQKLDQEPHAYPRGPMQRSQWQASLWVWHCRTGKRSTR
jgi:hypothetical protein